MILDSHLRLLRKTASTCELTWAHRACVITAAILSGTLTCFGGTEVSDWWISTYHMTYVVIFPQLICALYFKFVNNYGSMIALLVSLVLWLGGGDEGLGVAPYIQYPYFQREGNIQVFLTRTLFYKHH